MVADPARGRAGTGAEVEVGRAVSVPALLRGDARSDRHRQAWFRGKVASGLQAGGVAVEADLENGADALGAVVAEQPDFLLVEDKLPMVSGLDLT